MKYTKFFVFFFFILVFRPVFVHELVFNFSTHCSQSKGSKQSVKVDLFLTSSLGINFLRVFGLLSAEGHRGGSCGSGSSPNLVDSRRTQPQFSCFSSCWTVLIRNTNGSRFMASSASNQYTSHRGCLLQNLTRLPHTGVLTSDIEKRS